MHNCESCDVPSKDQYCKHCAPDGLLSSRAVVRSSWIERVMQLENMSKLEAAIVVDGKMRVMPAWKD